VAAVQHVWMSMRRLVTGDIHISRNPIDVYRMVFLKETLPALLDKYKIEQLLVLGDLTQDKSGHSAELVNDVVECFYSLSKKCEVIILCGNHDFTNKEYPFFQFLSKFDNISWINVPTEQDGCLFLPHTRNYKQDWKHLDFNGLDWIFAHNIFTGVNTNTGHALSGIPTSIFPDDAAVIAGDIHEPQTFDCITYVGAPFITEFGGTYQPRVLLLDGLKAKSIRVYGQQKRLLQLDWAAGGMIKLAQSANEGDIVKIQVSIQMPDVAKWAEIRQEVEGWAIQNKFIVSTIVPVVVYEQGERQKIVKIVRKTDYQYLEAFAKRNGVDNETVNIGKEIIEEN
jgi:predicted phosphodiesterase